MLRGQRDAVLWLAASDKRIIISTRRGKTFIVGDITFGCSFNDFKTISDTCQNEARYSDSERSYLGARIYKHS